MTFTGPWLYLLTFVGGLLLSLAFTPAARAAAIVLNIFDHPFTAVKTHKEPVPYLGGIAIFTAFVFALLWIRVLTSFPTGTLRALRGIVLGSCFISIVGLVDDVRHHGLHYRTKFFFQIVGALLVMTFGVRIRFVHPDWLARVLTVIWIVGVTNAFNLIDIMDGLASGVAAVACLAFLVIALPTEDIYVNVASSAMLGAVVGFVPYNVSKRFRIFMGDCGSLLLGFVASALALGTSYGGVNQLSVFAPLLILLIPLYDTTLVFYLRIRRGMSPFLGSKDHFALRLEMLGWPRSRIVLFCVAAGLLLAGFAAAVTKVSNQIGAIIYGVVGLLVAFFTAYVLRANVQ